MTTSCQPEPITGQVAIPFGPMIPSGIREHDEATGGGFPTNRMSVIYGGPDTGKSLLLYSAIANFQKLDLGNAVLLDLKGDYTPNWGRQLGIDHERLLMVRPDNAEMATEMLAEFIAAEDVGLICLDSLACLISVEELEKPAGEKVREGSGLSILRLLRAACIASAAREQQGGGPAIVCLNHASSGFGRPSGRHRMVGGAPPTYYASTVVRLDGGPHRWEDNVRIGMPAQMLTRGLVEKCAGKRCSIRFEYLLALPSRAGLAPNPTAVSPSVGGAS